MAKRPASKGSHDDSSSFALTDHLPDSAGQELKALRLALESRLVLLEEVLADPSRGESLTGLILDLARVATEEAQAAASQACVATRAEADKEIVALRTSAKAALDAAQASLKSAHTSLAREQASGADLRRAVDQATLENQKQSALLAAREQLEATLRTDRERIEAEVVRQQKIAADLQRAAGDLQRAASDAEKQLEKERRSSADRQSELKAERAAGAQLRQSAESAAARAAALERDLADERSAHEAAVVDLTEARAARHAAVADLTNARTARDAAVADLTNASAALHATAADLTEARAARDATAGDLTNARAALHSTAADLTEAHAARDTAAANLAEAHAARDTAAADLAEARAARDAAVADLARERKTAADRERGEGHLQSQLEFDRTANAQLKQSAESAMARLTILERDLVDEQSAHEAALADLTEARAAVADLRQAAARAEELSATVALEASRDRKPDEKAALLKQSLGEAREALAAAQAELEAERTTMAALHRAVEQADQQLASARSNEAQAVADHQKAAAQLDAMAREREAITDELTAARTWINELREAEAEFALPPAPPHVDVPHVAAKTAAPTSDLRPEMVEPEEGWQAVRLASRYLFSEDVSVQVNGDPARLFDLSVSGCQLLSPTALKPNQAVKVMLPNDKKPVACSGKVVWTRLEPMAPGQPLGYRAGVRFTKPDEVGIETFAARYATR